MKKQVGYKSALRDSYKKIGQQNDTISSYMKKTEEQNELIFFYMEQIGQQNEIISSYMYMLFVVCNKPESKTAEKFRKAIRDEEIEEWKEFNDLFEKEFAKQEKEMDVNP